MADPTIKILFCSFQVVPDATGLSTRATEFMRALQGRAIVDGLTYKSPERGHIERYHGARLMRVPVGAGDLGSKVQAFERAVKRQLESDEYQIVHVTDPFAGHLLADAKASGAHAYKLVYDACAFPSVELRYTDPHLEGDRAFMQQLRKKEQFCLMAADAVLCPSEVTRDYLVNQLGVSASKIKLMGPAVDLKHYATAANARPDRIPMRLLYLGSQATWQGLPTLLFGLRDALKQPGAFGLRLSIVGPQHATWRSELEEQVKGRGLTSNVEFLEPVVRDDLPRLLSQHDVGVAPLEKSDRNVQQGGLVMKVAEYAAAGRPMICADLPLLRGLVDESCALFFAAGREAALAKAMADLALNPARRVQLGQAARVLAQERFDADKVGTRLWELYSRLLELAEAPARSAELDDASDVPTSVASLLSDGPPPDTGKVAVARTAPEPTPVVPAMQPRAERPGPPVAEPRDEPTAVGGAAPVEIEEVEEIEELPPAGPATAPSGRPTVPELSLAAIDAHARDVTPPALDVAPPAPAPKPAAPLPTARPITNSRAGIAPPKTPAPAAPPAQAAPPKPSTPPPVAVRPPTVDPLPPAAPPRPVTAPPRAAPVTPPLPVAAPAPKPASVPSAALPTPKPASVPSAVLPPPSRPASVPPLARPISTPSPVASPPQSKPAVLPVAAPAPAARGGMTSLAPPLPKPALSISSEDIPELGGDDFLSMSEAVEIDPELLEPDEISADDLEPLSEPTPVASKPATPAASALVASKPTAPVAALTPSTSALAPSRDNSTELGDHPWLNGLLLGFAPLGQLHALNPANTPAPMAEFHANKNAT